MLKVQRGLVRARHLLAYNAAPASTKSSGLIGAWRPIGLSKISFDSIGYALVTLEGLSTLLDKSLGLNGRARGFNSTTPLLGSVPELDSIGVVTVLTALEEQYGFTADDDEISGATFATVGSLLDFVQSKTCA